MEKERDHNGEIYWATYASGFELYSEKRLKELETVLGDVGLTPLQRQGYLDGIKEAEKYTLTGRLSEAYKKIKQKLSTNQKAEDSSKSSFSMENEKVDEVYKKGFEHGYWMSYLKEREKDGAIQDALKHPKYSNGLKAGREEGTREQTRARMAKLKDKASKSKEKDKGIDFG